MSLRNRDSDSDGVLWIVFSQEVLQGSKCLWAMVARNKHYTETRIREAKDEGVGLEAGAEQGSLELSQTATAPGLHWWQGMVSIPSSSPSRKARAGKEWAVLQRRALSIKINLRKLKIQSNICLPNTLEV